MTSPLGPRGIVVLDLGATNTRAILFDRDLVERARESVPTRRIDGPPYLHVDVEPAIALASRVLPELDAILPVDAIVPCTHGSAAALVRADGGLALPVMSYEARPPAEIAAGYRRVAPPFEEVLATTSPGALTLALQLHWQQSLHPVAFSRATSIMPLAQYLAFRLCGVRASEVSSLGAQTHLWAPLERTYSTIARGRGWASRLAPLRSAWEPLGRVRRVRLRGAGAVLAGVHDSNASLLPFLGGEVRTLLSTGTWIIGFAPAVDVQTLDPTRDHVANVTVFGDPVASCRFMGGRELEILSGGAAPELASVARMVELLERGVVAWPAFTDSGGPVPGAGNRGQVEGEPGDDAGRASLAALYCAWMTALSLRLIGDRAAIVVDGPFAQNTAYLGALAACLPDRCVSSSVTRTGTAAGAARLALLDGASAPDVPTAPVPVPRALAAQPGLMRWLEIMEAQAGTIG